MLETAKEIQELSLELIQYGSEIASSRTEDEQHQLAEEKAEVLRRDWAAKVSDEPLIKMISILSSDAPTHSSY